MLGSWKSLVKKKVSEVKSEGFKAQGSNKRGCTQNMLGRPDRLGERFVDSEEMNKEESRFRQLARTST